MTDPSFDTFLAHDVARRHHAEAEHARGKAVLFAALAAAGITRLRIDFDGAGDSGQIETIEAFAGDRPAALPEAMLAFRQTHPDTTTAAVAQTLPLRDAVECLAYDCLAAAAYGWENNDGAFGELDFDIGAGTITLRLNERVIETVFSEHAF